MRGRGGRPENDGSGVREEDERSGDARAALLRARDRLQYGEDSGRRGSDPYDYDYASGDRSREYSIASRTRTEAQNWYYATDAVPSSSSRLSRSRYPLSTGSRLDDLRTRPREPMVSHSSTLESLLRQDARGGGSSSSSPTPSGRSNHFRDSGKPASTATVERKPRGRSTPYLTESNRQDIMERIRRGEKQADLAKEYNVSRAAITNLKQRRQMLEMLENSSNAKDREEALKRRRLSHGGALSSTGSVVVDEDSRRGTRSRPTNRRGSDGNDSDGSGQLSSTESTRGGKGTRDDANGEVDATETSTRPAYHRELNEQTTSRLLATLLDPATSDVIFRATVTRHTRLLLEEAIGWSFSRTSQSYEPFALAWGGEEAAMLLVEYLQMEPASPSATLRRVEKRAVEDDIEIVARVPTAALGHGPVLLFVDDLIELPLDEEKSSEGHVSLATELLLLVQALVFGGLVERQIVVVAALCDARIADDLGRRFPDVLFVTTKRLREATSDPNRETMTAFRTRRRTMMKRETTTM